MNISFNQLSIHKKLFLIGINYKSSPIEVRERFAFLPNDQEKALSQFHNLLGSAVILSTCNRTEIYFTSSLPEEEAKQIGLQILSQLKNLDLNLVAEHTNFISDYAAIEHLFKVSAGLESMILGEGQILNQVKSAYNQSKLYTDSFLNQLFQRALASGKRVRAQTEISRGAMSVSSAALQTIQKLIFPIDLTEKNIMVIGSGQVAELCIEQLHSQGASDNITLVSRSQNHSLLITKYGIAQNINYSQLISHLENQEIILVCTSAPHYLLEPDHFNVQDKKIIVCDMSLPRNVNPEVKNLPFIELIDLDYLQQTVEQNLSQRAAQIVKAQEILNDEMQKFQSWYQASLSYKSANANYCSFKIL